MDKLKEFANKAASGGGGSANPQQQQPQGGAGNEDYLDKAFAKGVDRTGYGGKVNREQEEKVTDGLRGAFEKATGKHVPDKFSN